MRNETHLSIEENVASSLFQPDILLPAQHLEIFSTKTSLESEKRLMLAVLEEAVLCFQKYIFVGDRRGKARFRDAEEWIMEENSDWLFSFENICQVLGFDPDYLRQGLLHWKEKKLTHRLKIRVIENLHQVIGSPNPTMEKEEARW
jgi:hypothetical protein